VEEQEETGIEVPEVVEPKKLTTEQIIEQFTNFAPTRAPLTFVLDGVAFKMRIPTVSEWSQFFNAVYQRKGDQSVYIDLAHRKFACLQLLVDEDGMAIFNEKVAQLIFRAPVGSPLDRLGTKAASVMEEYTSERELGNSENGSAKT
jgi:hypothetical protein